MGKEKKEDGGQAKKRIKKIKGKKYVKNPKMTVAAIAKVSTAAKSLCMWIHAMAIYDRVAKTVEPKKKLLAKMNAELDAANASLNEKQTELKEILDKVAGLKATLEATLAEKKQLEDDTALTQGRLQRAEKLTVGLADEHVRWQETVSTLDEKILNGLPISLREDCLRNIYQKIQKYKPHPFAVDKKCKFV